MHVCAYVNVLFVCVCTYVCVQACVCVHACVCLHMVRFTGYLFLRKQVNTYSFLLFFLVQVYFLHRITVFTNFFLI